MKLHFLSAVLMTAFSVVLTSAIHSAPATMTSVAAPQFQEIHVYVGTYTGPKSQGIYSFRLDATGTLTPLGLAAETKNPSFLAIAPNRKFLYATNETADFGGQKSGSISAFAINPDTGVLTLLNQVSSQGAAPCYVSISGQSVLAANYSSGTVSSFSMEENGKLSEAKTTIQHADAHSNKKPNAHSIVPDANNRFAVAADLGLDSLLVYRLTGSTLSANEPANLQLAPGAGPRHFVFYANGKFAYVINEKNCTINALSYDAERGELQILQTISTLPEGVEMQKGFSTAEVQVHPNGKFLYGSNRGHDSIAVYEIDATTGLLKLVQHQSTLGKTPRNFGIDPSGTFLLAANQNSDSIVSFRIDAQSGQLSPAGKSVEIGSPVCIKFLPRP